MPTVTVAKAAEILGIRRQAVLKRIHSHQLPAARDDRGRFQVDANAVLALQARRRSRQKANSRRFRPLCPSSSEVCLYGMVLADKKLHTQGTGIETGDTSGRYRLLFRFGGVGPPAFIYWPSAVCPPLSFDVAYDITGYLFMIGGRLVVAANKITEQGSEEVFTPSYLPVTVARLTT